MNKVTEIEALAKRYYSEGRSSEEKPDDADRPASNNPEAETPEEAPEPETLTSSKGLKSEDKPEKGEPELRSSDPRKATETNGEEASQLTELNTATLDAHVEKESVKVDLVQEEQEEEIKDAMSSFGGRKKSSLNDNATDLKPQVWEHVIKRAGLCQGYDIEELHPHQSAEPLFVRALVPQPGVEKPSYLPFDTMSIRVETTQTERSRYFVESGFRSADLSITVPYVAASIKAESMEKHANKQANKTVFFTTKAELPRCHVDIRSSVESGYLEINPNFVKRVKEIWWALRKKEVELEKVDKLDGKADANVDERLERRRRLMGNEPCGQAVKLPGPGDKSKTVPERDPSREKKDRAREEEEAEIDALRHTVYLPLKDLLKRYGSIWVEQVTLGGQIYSTKTKELSWQTSAEEKEKSMKTSVQAVAPGGAGAKIEAAFGSAQKSTDDDSQATEQVSHEAIGGDTLLYDPVENRPWIDSVKDPANWRAIAFKGVRMLDQLPKLEGKTVSSCPTCLAKNEAARCGHSKGGIALREVLSRLLQIAANVARYEENVARVPRRSLGAAWVHGLKGHWYGCYTWHKSLTQPPAPVVVSMTLDEPSVDFLDAETSGVESAYLHKLTITGDGHDDKGRFTMKGKIVELESKIERSKCAPYELLAVVDMRKTYASDAGGKDWHGAKTLKYAAKYLDGPLEKGCLSRFRHSNLRRNHTRAASLVTVRNPTPGPDAQSQVGLEGAKDEHEVQEVSPPKNEDLQPKQKDKKVDEEWVYRGHLDRTGMHGYWLYRGPTANPKAGKPEFAQEGGTWTMAPVDALPLNDESQAIEVRFPNKSTTTSYPIRLRDRGKDLKELFKWPASGDICVRSMGTPRKPISIPHYATLASVLTDAQLKHWNVPGTLRLEARLAKEGGSKFTIAPPPLPSPWTFVELEASINEPLRRWLYPPNAESAPGEVQGERPLLPELFKGKWQGYSVREYARETKLAALDGHAKLESAEREEVKKRGVKESRVHRLPPPSWVHVKRCTLTGGSVGSLRYVFDGYARQSVKGLPKWLWPTCSVKGTLLQIPNAKPRDEDADYSYPILAKVEAIGTPTFLRVPIPFRRQRFWKGHMDYLGIHGFTGRVGRAELRGSFGMMPVKEEEVAGQEKTSKPQKKEKEPAKQLKETKVGAVTKEKKKNEGSQVQITAESEVTSTGASLETNPH